jgi:phosphoribosylanthranilate isomerase
MWVKICANTNLKDAALAAELGASAVGFVFAKSKRQVTVPQVAAIAAALPKTVERIGVFDSQDADEIAEAASSAGLSGVQLHGAYDQTLVERLYRLLGDGMGIIQTLHWRVGGEDRHTAEQLASQLSRIADAGVVRRVLIDSKVNGKSGGTGVSFDWTAAQHVFPQAPHNLQLILAGGLTPENIAEAVTQLVPWGVDVASGVESSVGRKDSERLARFIQIATTAGRRQAGTRRPDQRGY